MTRKHAHHGDRHVPDRGIDDLPMFAKQNAAERRAARTRLQERIEPKIIELALRAGGEGITASEVTSAGIAEWGVWTGQEWRADPRAYAWLGPFLAQLARRSVLCKKLVSGFHVSRKSEREHSKGNDNKVYLHPVHVAERRESGAA